MFSSLQLDAVGEKIGPVPIPRDSFVQAGVQYPSGGSGTIELQGTLNGTDYETIGLVPSGGGAAVTSLSAAGIGVADVSVYRFIQVIMTVDGDVTPTLSLPTV